MTRYIKAILERGPASPADLARELQVTLPELLAARAAGRTGRNGKAW